MVTDVTADGGLSATIDSSGIFDNDEDMLVEHNVDSDAMWCSKADKMSDGIVYEFAEPLKLDKMVVWNYNKEGYVDYGVARADISIWTENDGWKQVKQGIVFDKAEGTQDYDSPIVVNLDLVEVQKLRLENITGWHKDGHVGLSEVQFFKPLGPKACNPVPSINSGVVYLSKMDASWTAGIDAVIHEIYLGQSEDNLKLLGRIKGAPKLKFDGLLPNVRYFWRVDEVSDAGTTTPGSVWSFLTRGNLLANWPFDDAVGQDVSETVKSLSGKLNGDPEWLPEEGKYGSAIYFDGDGDYVEIPTPALDVSTKTMTITGWFKADKNTSDRGLVFSRANGSAAALNLIDNELHYHWNDAPQTWDWGSGLELPVGSWAFAAVAVGTESATIYLYKDGKLESSTNRYNHKVERFDGTLFLAYDPHNSGRYYKGVIDDVRIYDYALSRDQIESLCKKNRLTITDKSDIKLLDVNFVEEGESIKEVAQQAAEDIDAEETESVESEADKERSFNFSAVIVIIVVMVIIAVISSSRKKE